MSLRVPSAAERTESEFRVGAETQSAPESRTGDLGAHVAWQKVPTEMLVDS